MHLVLFRRILVKPNQQPFIWAQLEIALNTLAGAIQVR
jgi:hypothetical protein